MKPKFDIGNRVLSFVDCLTSENPEYMTITNIVYYKDGNYVYKCEDDKGHVYEIAEGWLALDEDFYRDVHIVP